MGLAQAMQRIQEMRDEAERRYDPMDTVEVMACDMQAAVIEAFDEALTVLFEEAGS